MAEQTVADHNEEYGYQHAREALKKIAQAVAIMRAVSLAVAAQTDGAVRFDQNDISRWGPAIDAACACVHVVREALQEKTNAPVVVDWWTPLTLLEAIGAALWHSSGGVARANALSTAELEAISDAAIGSLSEMVERLSAVADILDNTHRPRAAA